MDLQSKVKQLGKRVQDAQASAARYREMERIRTERQRDIDAVPDTQRMDFWCETCNLDYSAIGHKNQIVGYDLDKMETYPVFPPRARYEGKCSQGHQIVRYITDRHLDKFFHLSRKVKWERAQYEDDMLQPSDPRFKIKYPRVWEELEAKREEREKHERESILQS